MAIRYNYDYAVDSSKGNITYASVTILAQEFLCGILNDCCYDDLTLSSDHDDVDVERHRL